MDRAHRPLLTPGMCVGWLRNVQLAAWSVSAQRASERYEFAHASLLEYAQTVPDLCDPEYRQRIHYWASRWRDAGWPVPADREEGTPRYLLDTYPATLAEDPQRLAELAGDIGWVEAAIASAGVDGVLADLRRAAAAHPG